jgi:hypothetical protein
MLAIPDSPRFFMVDYIVLGKENKKNFQENKKAASGSLLPTA